jgi:hypothetical protein
VCGLTKAIELVHSSTYLLQCLCKRVWFLAVHAQERIDYPLEERSSSSVRIEDADRGYCDRLGGVVVNLSMCQLQPLPLQLTAYQLHQSLLALLLLCKSARIELIVLFPLLRGVHLFLQPLEDLESTYQQVSTRKY